MKHKIESSFFLTAIIILVLFPWWLVFDSFLLGLVAIVLVMGLLVIGLRLINRLDYFQHYNDDNLENNQIPLFQFVFDKWKFLLLAFFGYFLLHAYALTKPVLPIDDEHFHIAKGLFFLQPIKLLAEKIGVISLYPFLAILSLILILLGIYSFHKIFLRRKIAISLYLEMLYKTKEGLISLFFALVCYYSLIYFLFHHFFQNFGAQQLSWLVRYGSVGTIINAVVSLIGFQELFFVRLVQLLFLFAAAIVFYFICQFYLDKKTSGFAAATFLVIPSVFYFGNLAFLEAGVLLFTFLSVYFFLVWRNGSNINNNEINNKITVHSHNTLALLLFFFSLFVGFFYKDSIIFIYLASCVFLFFELLGDCWKRMLVSKSFSEKIMKAKETFVSFFYEKKNKAFFVLSVFLLIFTFGWIIMRNKFLQNSIAAGYSFSVVNLLSSDLFLRYAKLSPLMLTGTFAVLCGIGFAVFFLRKKNAEERLLLWWVIVLYVIYTCYSWRTAVSRFYLQFLPALLIILFLFFEWLHQFFLLKKKIIKYCFYFAIFFYFLIVSLYLTYHTIDNRFWDYDDLYQSINHDVKPNEKILFLTHDVYYYFFKYNIHNPIITENEFRANGITTIDAFYQYIAENNVHYIVMPNPGNLYTSIGLYYPDPTKDKFLDDDRIILLQLNERIQKIDAKNDKTKFISGNNILYLIEVRQNN